MIFSKLTCNYLINIAFLSWVTAQLIKTAAFYCKNKTMNFKRLSESGGMPSAHSALVCSVAVGTAYKYGLSSPYFSFALTYGMIVMYDAMGVRRAAGEHAKVLNELHEYLIRNADKLPDEDKYLSGSFKRLSESLGHKPAEVFWGAVLGVSIALLSIFCFHWA